MSIMGHITESSASTHFSWPLGGGVLSETQVSPEQSEVQHYLSHSEPLSSINT